MEINTPESIRSYGNLASTLANLGELERSFAMVAEGLRLAERFGLAELIRWMMVETTCQLYFGGRWDDALQQLDEHIAEFERHPSFLEANARCWRGRIRLARGDTQGAQADAAQALELARVGKDPQQVRPALAFGARAFYPADPRRADDLAGQLLREWKESGGTVAGVDWLLDAAVVLPHLGRDAEFLEAAADAKMPTPWLEAAAAYVSGDLGRAADVYAEIGVLPDEAYARLRAAEALLRKGRRAEGDAELQRSLAFWRSVRATAYVREGEALLAASA